MLYKTRHVLFFCEGAVWHVIDIHKMYVNLMKKTSQGAGRGDMKWCSFQNTVGCVARAVSETEKGGGR